MNFNKIKDKLRFFFKLSLVKSFKFNYRHFKIINCFKWKVFISKNTKIANYGKRGNVVVKSGKVYFGMTSQFLYSKNSLLKISNNAKVVFGGGGYTIFSSGTMLIADSGSCIEFGGNFSCGRDCKIKSNTTLKFGDDVLIGWNVEIIGNDGHTILPASVNKSIEIGNNVWICKGVTILKGTKILNDSVIAAESLINKEFLESNILIGGTNKVLKRNIEWQR